MVVSQIVATDLELMLWRLLAIILLLMLASLFVRWRDVQRYNRLHNFSTPKQVTTRIPDQIADSSNTPNASSDSQTDH